MSRSDRKVGLVLMAPTDKTKIPLIKFGIFDEIDREKQFLLIDSKEIDLNLGNVHIKDLPVNLMDNADAVKFFDLKYMYACSLCYEALASTWFPVESCTKIQSIVVDYSKKPHNVQYVLVGEKTADEGRKSGIL